MVENWAAKNLLVFRNQKKVIEKYLSKSRTLKEQLKNKKNISTKQKEIILKHIKELENLEVYVKNLEKTARSLQ
jgi:valyl-tRNA synthetase